MKEQLTKSLETYLLAIDKLLEEKEFVIVKDVAKYLNFGGATTACAVKKLKEKGFINYNPYENITLTPQGIEAVSVKKYREATITNFLNKVLDIEQENAKYNAEQIEYSMTDGVLNRFVRFLDFMEQCSCKEPKWIKSCKLYLEEGKISDKCKLCSKGCCCSK